MKAFYSLSEAAGTLFELSVDRFKGFGKLCRVKTIVPEAESAANGLYSLGSGDARAKDKIVEMKRIILLYFTITAISAYGQKKENFLYPKIDNRIEYLNIVYQLARYGKAIDTRNMLYTNAINTHFLRYNNHRAISYTKKLIDKFSKDSIDIKDWELPSLGVHISQFPNSKAVIVNYQDTLDSWDDRTLLKGEYIQLLKDFYLETKAEQFFQAQQNYYTAIANAFLSKGKPIDSFWIQHFFQTNKTETYYPILSLSAAGGAYIRVNFDQTHRNTYTIFGCTNYDANGLPLSIHEPYFAWSILHETIHCYSNALVELHVAKFKPIGETLLTNKIVSERTKNTFYNNWRYLIYESLVRAVSIRYGIDNGTGKEKTEEDIHKQEALGFLWMRDLVDELNKYENNRTTYKDFSSFMPHIISAFEIYCKNYKNS